MPKNNLFKEAFALVQDVLDHAQCDALLDAVGTGIPALSGWSEKAGSLFVQPPALPHGLRSEQAVA